MAGLTANQIEALRSVIANLDGVQAEISAAVKRKASEPISPFQLKLINGVLSKADALLGNAKPIPDFDGFNADDIPTASDVSMVVSQYSEFFEKLRCENIQKNHDGSWIWTGFYHIQTTPPKVRK